MSQRTLNDGEEIGMIQVEVELGIEALEFVAFGLRQQVADMGLADAGFRV